MADDTKACPGCAQTIKAAAVLCRFCGFDFRVGQPVAAPVAPRKGLSGKMIALIVIIVLAVVGIPIIAIIAAIAIPGLLAAQRKANERNAATCLKVMATAEVDFRQSDPDGNQVRDYWTGDVSQLYYMNAGGSEIKLIDFAIANADAAPGKPTQKMAKNGYWFVAMERDEEGKPYDQGEGRNPNKYGFCAYPETYGSGGRSTFIVNEAGAVWERDTSGAPVMRFPRDPEREGWREAYR